MASLGGSQSVVWHYFWEDVHKYYSPDRKTKTDQSKDSTKAQLQQVQPISFIEVTYRSMGKGERKQSRND